MESQWDCPTAHINSSSCALSQQYTVPQSQSAALMHVERTSHHLEEMYSPHAGVGKRDGSCSWEQLRMEGYSQVNTLASAKPPARLTSCESLLL